MSEIFQLQQGSVPVLISMPHNGEMLLPEMNETTTAAGKKVADTDWYLDKLYQFAQQLGAYIITPHFSRYVIDLNRDSSGANLYPGANSTELCPTTTFECEPIYLEGKQPSSSEIDARIENYWRPYHQALADTLSEIKAKFGRAVLLEAHSIRSEVPRFFDGVLPDFNFGTNDGESCDNTLLDSVMALDFSPYSKIANGRFKGGYITRHFGQPTQGINAIQLELSQRTYMDEGEMLYNSAKAEQVQEKLQEMVKQIIQYAQGES